MAANGQKVDEKAQLDGWRRFYVTFFYTQLIENTLSLPLDSEFLLGFSIHINI